MRRVLLASGVVWICLKTCGCLLQLPGPWGPRVGGLLPNGCEVYFQARPVGRETDDRLTLVTADGRVDHFPVDRIHAGFEHVTLKFNANGDHVWVESDGRIGASLDLPTGEFRSETDRKHSWAGLSDGTTLASGRTGSIIWLLGPW